MRIDISEWLAYARKRVPVFSLWQHYKGGVYQVVGHAFDTGIANITVRYRRVGGPDFNAIDERDIEFTRDVEDWLGNAGEALLSNPPQMKKRFIRIDEE